MKRRYKIVWTDHALRELSQTVDYLRLNFSDREIHRLGHNIESVLSYISEHPDIYPGSLQQRAVRRAVIAKFNTLYYKIDRNNKLIEILSFFPNRKERE